MSNINFKPLNKCILVETNLPDKKTKSGIIKSEKQLDEEMKNASIYRKVVAISDDLTQDIKVGDEVLIKFGNGLPSIVPFGTGEDELKYFLVEEYSIKGKLLTKK